MKREDPIPIVVFGRLSRLFPRIGRGLMAHLEAHPATASDFGEALLSVFYTTANIVVVSWTLPGHVTNANRWANF
jgi:hypothetical protein